MYFKNSIRKHPDTGKLTGYYRLVESYRNSDGRVCHHTILNIGFMEDTTVEQRNRIQKHLTDKYEFKQSLFEETDLVVIRYVSELWDRIVTSKKIDIALNQADAKVRMVDIDTISHRDVREIGAEWIGYQTWEQLQIEKVLRANHWNEEQIQLAATQIISRAVYPASELRTARWIKENSAICELTGYDMEKMTKDKLYASSLALYGIREEIEKHLSSRTNDLFDIDDKIILYDLTNTYFEGRMVDSELAMFGRSKEKRSDAKLLVLALVVNMEGFIKYSTVHEGNIADCKSLPSMIDKLAKHTIGDKKPVIVLDAGIATAENLHLIEEKGYHYLCVSRSRLKDYEIVKDRLTVLMETKSKQWVSLKAVTSAKITDYYLEVNSPIKAKKEAAMIKQFEYRFEEALKLIQQSITTKGGVKREDKVQQRIGRAQQKYPSVQQYYSIEVSVNELSKLVTSISWKKDESKLQAKTDGLGIYFLRTNMKVSDETTVWNIYNTIREIESTFRTLKTDLDLRPIYHKTDKSSLAHLHLGLLAYWLVATIRHQLKTQNINSCWTEIVRIANTQKVITTSGQNTYNKTVCIRKCSEPNENLKKIYNALKQTPRPFRKRKSVVHKPTLKKIETPYSSDSPPH